MKVEDSQTVISSFAQSHSNTVSQSHQDVLQAGHLARARTIHARNNYSRATHLQPRPRLQRNICALVGRALLLCFLPCDPPQRDFFIARRNSLRAARDASFHTFTPLAMRNKSQHTSILSPRKLTRTRRCARSSADTCIFVSQQSCYDLVE